LPRPLSTIPGLPYDGIEGVQQRQDAAEQEK